MFIPVGLEIKHKDVPWFTMLVVAITVVVSIYAFDSILKNGANLYKSDSYKNLQNAKIAYLKKLCKRNQQKILSTQSCKIIQRVEARAGIEVALINHLRSKKISKRDIKTITEFFDINKKSIKGANVLNREVLMHQRQMHGTLLRIQKQQHLLSKDNITPASILKAQLTHSGWMHLIGNMMFLIAMCIAVEQRLGWSKTALLYFSTGTIALPAYVLLNDSFIHIVGASANVFGIMGAFVALFYNKNIKLLFSYNMLFYKTVKMPVLVYSTLFVIFSELVGLSSQTNVANGAHLIGFVIGFGVAYGFRRADNLPDEYIYRYEYQLVKRAKKYLHSSNFQNYLKFIDGHCKESKPLQKTLFTKSNLESFNTLPDKTAAQNIFAEHIKSLHEEKQINELIKSLELFKSLSQEQNFKKKFHNNFWVRVNSLKKQKERNYNVA